MTAGAFPDPVAGGGGGGAIALWKWNEVDLTQFGASIATPNAGTLTLALNATRREENRIDIITNVFNGPEYYPLLDDLGAIQVFPSRYVIRVRFEVMGDPSTPGVEGLLIRGSGADATLFGYHVAFRSRSALDAVEAGVGGQVDASGNTTTAVTPTECGEVQIFEVTGEPGPVQASPQFTIYGRTWGPPNGNPFSGYYSDRNVGFAYLNGAGWAGGAASIIALGGLRQNLLATITATTTISELAVYPHPMDYPVSP